MQDPFFCDNIGKEKNGLNCCYPDDQNSQACRDNFNTSETVFTEHGACLQGTCIADCQNVTRLYSSIQQITSFQGNGQAPIHRYLICANVPNMARYRSQKILQPSLLPQVVPFIPGNVSDGALQNITLAVTECLTATCGQARDNKNCQVHCSGVNLLVNRTTPNIKGLNTCLNTLCEGNHKSLPFADEDVIGIGVRAVMEE